MLTLMIVSPPQYCNCTKTCQLCAMFTVSVNLLQQLEHIGVVLCTPSIHVYGLLSVFVCFGWFSATTSTSAATGDQDTFHIHRVDPKECHYLQQWGFCSICVLNFSFSPSVMYNRHRQNRNFTGCRVPVKGLDTPTHSRVFLYFYYLLRCKIIVKTSKLLNNTYGIMQ